MKIPELIEKLQWIQGETGSHPNIDGQISFFLGDQELEIEEIETVHTIGCNCVVGATVEFKKL
jgi:hypothetical protein